MYLQENIYSPSYFSFQFVFLMGVGGEGVTVKAIRISWEQLNTESRMARPYVASLLKEVQAKLKFLASLAV